MRTTYWITVTGGLLSLVGMLEAGCWSDYDNLYLPLTNPALATTGSGGHDGGTGTGGSNPDCAGDPSGKNVNDTCGVFVQADSATGVEDGTMANPFTSLQLAVNATGGKRVYVCTSAPFKEAVTIDAGVEVYGGFTCAKGWSWSPDARAQLKGPADSVALTISGDGAKVEGFAIMAASPSDPKGGGSSIGVVVDDVAVTLERCDVTASDAADGAKGTTPTDSVAKGADAAMPDMMTENACVLPAAVGGGAAGVTTCDDGTTSGGMGGKGGITGMPDGNGQSGADGSPMDMMNGLGGAGESTSKCVAGGTGNDGTPGPSGPGGSISSDKLSLSGITNSDVTDGQPGTKAQGGGGGGGAKSGPFCGGGVDGPGASGGGGGAGGCGGKGGGGGKAGGSSIAIVSLGTKLVLIELTLATGHGGKGGDGATGQNGGDPGAGAVGGAKSATPPSTNGCKGGDGGSGGPGGSGGGGRGGHSIGIAYASAPAMMPVVKTFTAGMPGGVGNGASGAQGGAPGSAGQCWDFTTHASCSP
jgi:hypothetical protein